MLAAQRWCVAGDVLNPIKPAQQVVQRLIQHNRHVFALNPRLTDVDLIKHTSSSTSVSGLSVINDIKQLKEANIEVLNLCIHPALGLNLVQQAQQMGINNVFIQPGAESPEILNFIAQHSMQVHQGCVLREML